MNLKLSHDQEKIQGDIKITGSKSESNRLLILQALYPNISIENLSNSDDTQVLQKALNSSEETIDIHHAGTAMRFLTAYFASRKDRKTILTGSQRMQERPIQLLVEALNRMGADIIYPNEIGYPPLDISGKALTTNSVKLKANISSQYISALMLIGASLPEGLEIELEGEITSTPYILMTLEIMKLAGIKGEFKNKKIMIPPVSEVDEKNIAVESDWSSASYFYSIAAIAEGTSLKLSNFRKDSRQGDSSLAEIYKKFGVETSHEGNSIFLRSSGTKLPKYLKEDLRNSPDIAQTIAVTCLAKGIGCKLTGLHTLKIKETDRLEALKNEIEKFGGEVEISEDSLTLHPLKEWNSEDVLVKTYNDHRMAMAFAPLALKRSFQVEDAMVVSKSYPDFWEDLKKIGFNTVKTA